MKEDDLYRREDLPGFIINQAAKLITDLLHENFKLANQEVTPEQWIILDELWRHDGLTQLEIAQATFRQQTSTSRILDNLVKREIGRASCRERVERRGEAVRLDVTTLDGGGGDGCRSR